MVILYQHDLTGNAIDDLCRSYARESGYEIDCFTREEINAVLSETDKLDSVIDRCSSSWTSHRMAPLERSILRIAVREILDIAEIPVAVSIDEAITLAKRFCSREAAILINGILGKLADEIQGESAK